VQTESRVRNTMREKNRAGGMLLFGNQSDACKIKEENLGV